MLSKPSLTFSVLVLSSLALADNPLTPSTKDLSDFDDSVKTPPAAPLVQPPPPQAQQPSVTSSLPASIPTPGGVSEVAGAPISPTSLGEPTPQPSPQGPAPEASSSVIGGSSPAPKPTAQDEKLTSELDAPPPHSSQAPAESPSQAPPQAPTGAPSMASEPDIEPPPPEITNSGPEEKPQKATAVASQSGVEPAVEPSESDSKREERYSRIYAKYNRREISNDKWSEIAGEKSSESYKLQNGDNLWDISSKLFGNGFYWPKVWELNDDITNPHDVKVGRTLKFSPGSSTAAPALEMEESKDVNITEATTKYDDAPDAEPDIQYETIVSSDAGSDQIPIPPGKRSRPVLNHIPPSFPESARFSGNFDRKTGFAKNGLVRPVPKVVPGAIPSIVVEEEWAKDGKLIEMEGDTAVASTYQKVVLHLSAPAQAGDMFTVFSTHGKVTDPTTDNTIGLELETRAEVQIEEAIEGSANTYRGIVTFTVLPARLNDSVKAGRLIPRATFESGGVPSQVAARIINGEDNNRKVFGLFSVVYLDKGQEDGLQVNSILPVLKNISVRNPDTAVEFDSNPIGTLKVVQVEPHVSTAIVVSEEDAVRPGDMTALVSDPSFKNPDADDNEQAQDAEMGLD